MGRQRQATRQARWFAGGVILATSFAAISQASAAGPTAALQGSLAGGPAAFFGYSVAASANSASVNTVAVGAWNDGATFGDTPTDGNGAVYVYVQSGSTWSLQQKVTALDGAPDDEFGYTVALSGDTLLVGAGNRNSGQGAVYSFARTGGSWAQQGPAFTSTDGTAGDCFGCSIALSGTTAVLGAPGRLGSTGAAYVYTQTSSWQLATEFVGNAPRDEFGFSVGLSPDETTAVAGAFGASSSMGEVYLFTKSGASWATPAQALIQAADGQTKDAFGYSVAAGNGEVLVGAYQNGSTSPGAAYVFAGNGTSWSQQTKLVPSDGVNGDFFGYSVALSGNTALVGAYEKAMQTGAAYVFTSTGGAWAQTEVSAPAAGQSFGYSVALSGTVAAVGTTGNNSDMLYIYGLATSPPPPAPALGRRGNAAWLALGLAFVGAMLSRRSRGGA